MLAVADAWGGAIAFLLDGYFLGLTQGALLRDPTLLATGVGFLPWGGWAHSLRSPAVLRLSLISFVAIRAVTLASQGLRSMRAAHEQVTVPDPAT